MWFCIHPLFVVNPPILSETPCIHRVLVAVWRVGAPSFPVGLVTETLVRSFESMEVEPEILRDNDAKREREREQLFKVR